MNLGEVADIMEAPGDLLYGDECEDAWEVWLVVIVRLRICAVPRPSQSQ